MVNYIWCSKSAPILLIHVSLLLAIISGAGIATLARLKWDPSTYLIVRGLFPTEYRVLGGVLCFGSFLLVVLAHVAVLAMSIRSGSYQHWRQAMFFTYAAMMLVLILVELVTVSWLCARVVSWLKTKELELVLEAIHAIKEWNPVIQTFVKIASYFFKPLQAIHDSIMEILDDVPCNLYVAISFVVFVAVLQPAAVVLAVNAAFTYRNNTQSTKAVHSIRYNINNDKNNVTINTKTGTWFQQQKNYLAAIKNKF